MPNPRNDAAELERLCADREACPSWWGCEERGCYEDAKRNYAEQHHFAPSYRYQDERSPDGRSIYLDHKGHYKPKKDVI